MSHEVISIGSDSETEELVITESRTIDPKDVRNPNNKRPRDTSIETTIELEDDPVPLSKKPNSETQFYGITSDVSPNSLDISRSPIRLIKCESLNESCNKDTVSMSDLLGSPDLVKTYQFNLVIDFDFISRYITAPAKSTEIVLINAQGKDAEYQTRFISEEAYGKYPRLRIVNVEMFEKFTSHHTKMMINFFKDNTLQIIVHTMNLTHADYNIQTQMAWLSPRLKQITKDQPSSDNDFQKSFMKYLSHYKSPVVNTELRHLISKFDFSCVQAEFVGHAPGTYNLDLDDKEAKTPLMGYARLYQLLKKHELFVDGIIANTTKPKKNFKVKIIAQQSSIAAPFAYPDKNLFLNLLTPLITGKQFPVDSIADFAAQENIEPVVIWPTEKEVSNALYGVLSGNALHLDIQPKNRYIAKEAQYKVLKNYLYRWGNPRANILNKGNRHLVSPHCKTYCVTMDNFQSLEWILLTSANNSKQAWGVPVTAKSTKSTTKDTKAPVSASENIHVCKGMSYEAGVLIHPKLFKSTKPIKFVPVLGCDKLPNRLGSGSSSISPVLEVPIRIPYDLPLMKYTPDDKAWNTASPMPTTDQETGGPVNPELMKYLAN